MAKLILSFWDYITLNMTSEELFVTNHLRDESTLLNEINDCIKYIQNNPIKLEILYNVAKSLTKE